MTFQEAAAKKGKIVLYESFSIQLEESNLLIEDVKSSKSRFVEAKGKKYEAFAIVRRVPVTRFVENKNGRVYPRPLWENIYKNKLAERTLCLADHPGDNDEGSVTRIAGVWHNFSIAEDYCYADLYLVGPNGKIIYEALMAGGRVGMSSVGYGELKEDSKTVDPDSYELVRLADAVLDPSQSVFADIDMLEVSGETEQQLNYATDTDTDSKPSLWDESVKNNKSSFTNNKEKEVLEESSKKVNNMSLEKLQESNLRNQVRLALKEARNSIKNKNISRLMELNAELKEISDIIPEAMVDEKTKLTDMISQVESEVQDSTENLSQENVTLQEKYKNAMEKFKAADAIASSLKEKYTKAMNVISKLGGSENNIQKLQMLEDMNHDIKCFMEDRDVMQKDINVLLAERETMLKDIKVFTEDRNVMQADLDALIEDSKLMQKDIKKLLEDRVAMEADLNEFESMSNAMESDIGQFETDRSGMEEDIKQLVADRKVMKEDMKKLLEDRKVMFEDLKKFRAKYSEGSYGESLSDDPYANAIPDHASDVLKTNLVSGEQDQAIASVDIAERNRFRRMKQERISERGKTPVAAFTESYARVSTSKEIQNFFEEEVAGSPALDRIKSKVLGAKSLLEAVRMVESFKSNQDEQSIRLNESTKSVIGAGAANGWTDGYL